MQSDRNDVEKNIRSLNKLIARIDNYKEEIANKLRAIQPIDTAEYKHYSVLQNYFETLADEAEKLDKNMPVKSAIQSLNRINDILKNIRNLAKQSEHAVFYKNKQKNSPTLFASQTDEVVIDIQEEAAFSDDDENNIPMHRMDL